MMSTAAEREEYVRQARERIDSLRPEERRDLDQWWERGLRERAEEQDKRDDPRWHQ